ncbi:MAG: hypothetical protein HeimC2_31150 [Candidatus Heimdallarchaeota archaeon LC_2]|nr:MAG: hypothetical protein HeimC2_31150 [Candidatus Heimdallarchaeota archaeon LC_2]
MKTQKIYFLFPFFLIVLGVLSAIFTYYYFPQLIPSYGGGEVIKLNSNNNYEMSYGFEPRFRLLISIEVDNPVVININQEEKFSGIDYSVTLNTSLYYVINIKGTMLTEGFMKLKQEIPTLYQLFTFGLLLSGILLYIFYIHLKKR